MANIMTIVPEQVRVATTWSEYKLGSKTRALLGDASKLTETPSLVSKDDIGSLREAASGLPPDQIPEGAKFAEARNS